MSLGLGVSGVIGSEIMVVSSGGESEISSPSGYSKWSVWSMTSFPDPSVTSSALTGGSSGSTGGGLFQSQSSSSG